jgi:hypothetical protein
MSDTDLMIVRVTAQRWAHAERIGFEAPDRRTDYDEHSRTYEVAGPVDALTRFAEAFPAIPLDHDWHLKAYTPSPLPRPERHLKNWERDPDAEVSDGWLSNLAASANTLADELAWQSQYCTRAHKRTPCPGCETGQLAERTGKFGAFWSCTSCEWHTSAGTKKGLAAAEHTFVTGWCGTLLEVRYGHLGNPYPGCKTCDPEYKSPTVDDLRYGRR